MTQVKDPVCGMMIDPRTAAGSVEYQGTTYYFCSVHCLRQFEADPRAYVSTQVGARSGAQKPTSAESLQPHVTLEQHEPPRTTTGWLTVPKFGAAGSGGLEYELLPGIHDEGPGER